LILFVLVLAGCATNPTLRWSQARNILSTTQDSIRTLHERQVISDEELVQIDTAVQTGRHALAVQLDGRRGRGAEPPRRDRDGQTGG
jgi:hypothetical protein